MGSILWHYTTGERFFQIIKDGLIRPARARIPDREKPVVWFSANQWWEETSNRAVRDADGKHRDLTMKETHEQCGGLFRIGVSPETAPYDWRALKKLSGMTAKTASGLYANAREHGANPNEWWGTFEAVPTSKWVAIQKFDGKQWAQAPLDGLEGLIKFQLLRFEDDHSSIKVTCDDQSYEVRTPPLDRQNERALIDAFQQIIWHYNPEVFHIPLQQILNLAGRIFFHQADMGAFTLRGKASYTSRVSDDPRYPPAIILTIRALMDGTDKLAVTVLHEILHILFRHDFPDEHGIEHATFHWQCYKALGLDLADFEPEHWAYQQIDLNGQPRNKEWR